MYNTKTYAKEYGYLLIQAGSSIFKNNNMTSQNFNSFSDEIFFRTLRTPVVTFLSHFYQKDSCGSYNVNVATIFTQHFGSKLFKICPRFLWQLRTLDWSTKYLVLDIRYFYAHSSAKHPAIHGSRVRIPAETILPFQYHVEWHLFHPKTAHFVPLKVFSLILTASFYKPK